MRLAIIGSQSFSEIWKESVAGNLIRSFLGFQETEIEVIISGGCPTGVDAMAERLAHWYGFTEDQGDLVIHRPSELKWESAYGFKARNLAIAEDCTHLLCIRDRDSRTYGSGWTADKAEELGKHVWRFAL